METRKLSKMKEEVVPEVVTFEEVTVKEEPVLGESGFHEEQARASTSRKRSKAGGSTNKSASTNEHANQSTKETVRKKSRYTQTIPEDSDLDSIGKPSRLESLTDDKPIDPAGLGEIVPQCRICLRRVSRENLEIIEAKHRKKAKLAFQIRIFAHDAYPYICYNCLNLMDIFIDFRNAVTRAKSLLVNQKAYLESNGWDDPDYVDVFHKCKQVVELHRKQIESMYELLTNPPKEEYVDQVDDGNNEECMVANNDVIDDRECEPTLKPECIITEDVVSSLLTENSTTENVISSVLTENPTTENVVPSLTPENSTTKIVEQNAEEGQQQETEVADFSADDSMDEDFVPEGEEEDDEEFVPKEKEKKQKSPAKKKKDTAKAGTDKASGEKPKVKLELCSFCGASVRPESVESHRNLHLGIRPYPCSVEGCTLTFTGRFNLQKHIKRIHNDKQVHTCNICGKQIRGTPGVLAYHKRRHVEQKSFVCQVCGKGFTMKWYLTQHSVIHTGEFPHKCKYCGKKFNNKWSMKTHEKNIHEKKNQIMIEENQSWNPESFAETEPEAQL